MQVGGIVVPRFYFDVWEGAKLTPDEAGRELDSLEAAERVATEAVADIGRDRLPKGNACAVTVELRDEHRQRVLMVTVSMEIHRMDPAPELLRA
jgi:hypothetical protein